MLKFFYVLAALVVAAALAMPVPAEAKSRKGGVEEVYRQSVDLGVPAKELSSLVDECKKAGFTSGEVERILSLIAKAKVAGLPHNDLLSKLSEGLAKKVSPEAINNALEKKARMLVGAKRLVEKLLVEGFTTNNKQLAIQIVSDAMSAGTGEAEVLRSLRTGNPLETGNVDVRKVFKKPR